MLSDGQQYFASGNYYLIVFPALAIVITSFAFSLVGEGLNAERESVE
jgi:ABC-type dipeptide/oligopeptide/nickel transport system permease subunit